METAPTVTTIMKGAGWLVSEATPAHTFIPEDFNEEHNMVLDMCHQFIHTEVDPILDRIDKLEPGLMPSLVEKAGDLGMLGISIPEQYGGLGKEFTSGILVLVILFQLQ
jgi:alkylation response protein AidB-like acyl-CoA dehydrogenase